MKSLGLLVLRVVFGGLIAIHGYPKLFGGKGKSETLAPEAKKVLGEGFAQSMEGGGLKNFAGMIQNMDMPAPTAMAGLSAGAEFFGGLALLLGWNTRLACLLLLGNMGTAIRKVHWEKGLLGQGGFENPLTFAAAFLALFIAGPGKLSLDGD